MVIGISLFFKPMVVFADVIPIFGNILQAGALLFAGIIARYPFGGVTWCGQRAMRISVCNWQTSDDDIDRTVASVRRVLSPLPR